MVGRGILHLSSEFFIRSPTKDIIMRILFKTSLVLFLSLFLFHSGIDAQIFEKLNGPYGGGEKVLEGKNGVYFQVFTNDSYVHELYKSVNGGTHWTRVSTVPNVQGGNPLNVGLDGNLYALVNGKIIKSVNDGQSWSVLNSPPEAAFGLNTINALPDGTILCSSSGKVLQSTDNGQTWNSSSIYNINYFFYEDSKDRVYALSNETIYRSFDRGLNWTLFSATDFGNDNLNMVIAGNGNILVSGDEFIWRFDSTGILINKMDPFPGTSRQIDMAMGISGRLFAFKYYKSFYSDNLGDSWIEFGNSGSNSNAYQNFVSVSNGALFGIKLGGGLYKSTDNGKSWLFAASGLNFANVSEVRFISDLKILALTSDGLFYSEDAAKTWTYLFPSHDENVLPSSSSRIALNGEEIYFSEFDTVYYFKDWKSNPSRFKSTSKSITTTNIFINHQTGSLFVADINDLYRSLDKAKTWKKLGLKAVQDLINFPDGSIIASTTEKIYRSTDDGDTWNEVFNAAPNFLGWDNKLLNNSQSSAYLIYNNQTGYNLASTVDNGITWSVLSIDELNSSQIAPEYGQVLNNLEHIYIGGFSGEILRSLDFGNNFNTFNSEFDYVRGLFISPAQKLWVIPNLGLYRSKIELSASHILHGNVYTDLNFDCNYNANEPGKAKRLIVADNGLVKQYGYSKLNGDYSIPIESGTYDIEVATDNLLWTSCKKTIAASNYDFNDTLKLGLQVNTVCPFMKVEIQSTILRRCVESSLYINYSNTGTRIAKNAYIDVILDPFFEFISSSKPFSSQNGNEYRFLLGDVDESTSGSFSIKVKVSCNAQMGQIHCAEAHIYPDTPCVQSARAIIRTSVNCLGDSIELMIRNDGNKDMAAVKNWWVVDLSKSNSNIQSFDGGTFYLSAGQVYTKRIASRSRVLFIAEQDESYPYNKTSRTEIISCTQNPLPGSPPLNISNLDEEEPYISKFCERNRGSFDPNDITGYPDGITDKRYIDNEQQLDYVIRFQNTGTDTAFNIRIENQIPIKELDLATLSLGASSHPYQFILSPEGKLIFSFSNVLLPDSNINEVASHGFVQYSIKPIDKLSNGTKILNDALIYFDFNDGVNTNVDLHTIGSPIPVMVNEVNKMNEIDFQIEPNPVKEFSSILINSNYKNEHYKLSCLDVYSKQMWEMDVKGNRAAIQKGDMKPGVYLLVLKSRSGLTLRSKKLIVD